MFKKIIMALAKKYIEQEKKERDKKYEVLLKEAYKWFYQYIQMAGPTADGIDLPLSAEKIAEYNTLKALIKVVKDDRVEEVYKKCLNHINSIQEEKVTA